MSQAHESGQAAEQQARAHLERHGLRLLASNWRCRAGELDLVMLDGATVVFVEVRYRRHAGWGGALESIDSRKRGRLISAAQLFLQQQTRWSGSPCRFDVVALDQPDRQSTPRIQWLQNAFES